jgi:large subunit ribosomal protein L24
MHVKAGETVLVIAGKDKGKKGKILRAFPRLNKILVEGVNMQWKHQRPKKSNEKGQRVQKALPIDVSNVRKAKEA